MSTPPSYTVVTGAGAQGKPAPDELISAKFSETVVHTITATITKDWELTHSTSFRGYKGISPLTKLKFHTLVGFDIIYGLFDEFTGIDVITGVPSTIRRTVVINVKTFESDTAEEIKAWLHQQLGECDITITSDKHQAFCTAPTPDIADLIWFHLSPVTGTPIVDRSGNALLINRQKTSAVVSELRDVHSLCVFFDHISATDPHLSEGGKGQRLNALARHIIAIIEQIGIGTSSGAAIPEILQLLEPYSVDVPSTSAQYMTLVLSDYNGLATIEGQRGQHPSYPLTVPDGAGQDLYICHVCPYAETIASLPAYVPPPPLVFDHQVVVGPLSRFQMISLKLPMEGIFKEFSLQGKVVIISRNTASTMLRFDAGDKTTALAIIKKYNRTAFARSLLLLRPHDKSALGPTNPTAANYLDVLNCANERGTDWVSAGGVLQTPKNNAPAGQRTDRPAKRHAPSTVNTLAVPNLCTNSLTHTNSNKTLCHTLAVTGCTHTQGRPSIIAPTTIDPLHGAVQPHLNICIVLDSFEGRGMGVISFHRHRTSYCLPHLLDPHQPGSVMANPPFAEPTLPSQICNPAMPKSMHTHACTTLRTQPFKPSPPAHYADANNMRPPTTLTTNARAPAAQYAGPPAGLAPTTLTTNALPGYLQSRNPFATYPLHIRSRPHKP
ncbi:MAG: hypothetical protein FJY48_13010, partial [Betaproteobacteria bacterium]|nr:hypothetical protein [Betaproteobacteria bacterium]